MACTHTHTQQCIPKNIKSCAPYDFRISDISVIDDAAQPHNNNLFLVARSRPSSGGLFGLRCVGVQHQHHWTNHITVICIWHARACVCVLLSSFCKSPSSISVGYFDGFQDGSMTNNREQNSTLVKQSAIARVPTCVRALCDRYKMFSNYNHPVPGLIRRWNSQTPFPNTKIPQQLALAFCICLYVGQMRRPMGQRGFCRCAR